jgi:hypothetical protein
MLRGLAQLIFFSNDMAAAKRWYTELLGIGPYSTLAGSCCWWPPGPTPAASSRP